MNVKDIVKSRIDRPINKSKEPVKDYVLVILKNIKKGYPFINLFPIKPDVLKSISEDMKVNGYDFSQPVIIWKETDLLIDGHTRSKAAELAGIEEIPAIYYSFPDVDAALKYAYGLQFKRRNLDDSDKFGFAEQYLNNVVQIDKKGGWKKKELAHILSVSMTTAQKYLSVISRGSDRDKEKVKLGQITINVAYKNLLQKEGGNEKSSSKKSKTVGVDSKTTTKPVMEINGYIYISTTSLKRKINKWAKNEALVDRVVAIGEIIPKKSELGKYIKGLLDKEDSNVSV